MIEEKKNKKKVLSIVIALILLVVIAGVTYAVWNYAFTGGENVISTDEISIEYLESTDVIDITNALPMSDSQGKAQEETFDFEVTTRTSGYANICYSLILEELEVDSGYEALTSNQINIGLFDYDNKELVTLNVGSITNSNGVIYSDVNKHSPSTNEISDKYKLRAWIDSGVDASKWNEETKLQYKFRINVDASGAYRLDKSGANEPVLTGIEETNVQGSSIIPLENETIQITKSNMIPVYYDESESAWKKADETNTIEEYKWYDYNAKTWANTVTVTAASRETYQNATLGTPISMNDILTMQVWIPRYKYKVWNYNLAATTTSNPQSIEITFESGKESTGEIKCTDSISGTAGNTSETCVIKETSVTCTDATCNGKTYTHPAFTFGDDELSGFWVGKFENSHDGGENACTPVDYESPNTGCNVTTMNVKVVSNVTSWRGIQLGTSYTNIMKMNDTDNMYGFIENQDDTHMMKNSEWGAVAYLSHSKYGKNAELEMNTNSGYKTGCGPIRTGSSTATTECSTYETELGQGASTTGNIYGIYDMSGGAWDQMMSNMVSPSGAFMSGLDNLTTGEYKHANSGFKGIVYDGGKYTNYTGGLYTLPENAKYYERYSFATTYDNATARKRSKLGDGIREVYNTGTAGWYSDYSYLADSNLPWFFRGGSFGNEASAGLFSSYLVSGHANVFSASRLVISQ